MRYKSEKNEVVYPIANVIVTRDEELITHITVEIENSVFPQHFSDPTEMKIIAQVLTGKMSPQEGFASCCEEYYSPSRDTNSYPSAILLRFKLSNSKECKPFIKGNIFNEINPYIEKLDQRTYSFKL
jgi:hypothetical protein